MKKTISRLIGFASAAALFCAGCGGGGPENPNGDADGLLGWMAGYTLEIVITDTNRGFVKIQPQRDFYEAGEKVTVTATANDGYGFAGWYDDYAHGGLVSKESPWVVTIGRNYKLRADWDAAYTVAFNANGAAGTPPPPQKQVIGSNITLPDDGGLTRDKYIFRGWSAHSGGTEITYAAGDAYMVSGNDTLYAQWAALTVDTVEMITVTGGTFTMGESGVETAVDDFLLGKYEVTQKLWRDVMGNNLSQFKGDSLPVENVSWYDIQDFFDSLESKTGKRYRLPTEAEWEFAARGGDGGGNYLYSGGNTASNVAVYGASSPANVGGKKANGLGIHDMSGNVWEWVEDRSDLAPNGGGRRVIRGGGWDGPERNCTVSRRQDWDQGGRYNDLGFRLARDP